MSAAAEFERAIEKARGVDDPTCPDCGEVVPLGDICECGWHEGKYLQDAEDAKWDRWREERLADDGRLWEGEN